MWTGIGANDGRTCQGKDGIPVKGRKHKIDESFGASEGVQMVHCLQVNGAKMLGWRWNGIVITLRWKTNISAILARQATNVPSAERRTNLVLNESITEKGKDVEKRETSRYQPIGCLMVATLPLIKSEKIKLQMTIQF